MAKRVLLVPDVPGWCWDYQARGIQRYAPPEYDVTIMHEPEWNEQTKRAHGQPTPFLKKWDAVLVFGWATGRWTRHVRRICCVLAHHGCMEDLGSDWLRWERCAATVQRNRATFAQKVPAYDAALSVNRRLHDYAISCGVKSHYTISGVDTNIFMPDGRPNGGVNVGWCGQFTDGQRGVKGVYEILRPLVAMGAIPNLRMLSRNHTNALSQQEMVEWHRGNDLFLCTSISEGDPMPPAEALACGVPVLTTSVGSLPETIERGGQLVGEFTDQRSADDVVELMRLVLADPQRWKRWAEYARAEAVRRSWARLAPVWLRAICGKCYGHK